MLKGTVKEKLKGVWGKITGVERYIKDIYLMFLSQEIDIKLCQNNTKIYMYEIWKVVGLTRLYSASTQPTWKQLYPIGAWES